MQKRPFFHTALFFGSLLLLIIACQLGGTGPVQSPADNPLPPVEFPQVTLVPEYTDCVPANLTIAELGKYFIEAATAMVNGDLATYEAILAKASSVEVPQYKEAMVYKNSIITGIQLVKQLTDDPNNAEIALEYKEWGKTIDAKAEDWRAVACGPDDLIPVPELSEQNSGQPSQSQDNNGQGDPLDGSSTGYECDPGATDAFWYDKLVPAYLAVDFAVMPRDPNSLIWNGNASEEEIRVWIQEMDDTMSAYRQLGPEAASICPQMREFFETWEDGLGCLIIESKDMVLNHHWTSPETCSASQYRHPDFYLVYGNLTKASGLDLYTDGVRR